MKRNSLFITSFLLLVLLVSACAPSYANPVKLNEPTYVPGKLSQVSLAGIPTPAPNSCLVRAVDLIGAWVTAGAKENDPFSFTSQDEKPCQGTFNADILPLFIQANLWYPGAPSCRTCHTADVNYSYARMDLSSYQGILAGSGRDSASAKGQDILGGGNWQQARLFDLLSSGQMPPETPEGTNPKGPLVHAGALK